MEDPFPSQNTPVPQSVPPERTGDRLALALKGRACLRGCAFLTLVHELVCLYLHSLKSTGTMACPCTHHVSPCAETLACEYICVCASSNSFFLGLGHPLETQGNISFPKSAESCCSESMAQTQRQAPLAWPADCSFMPWTGGTCPPSNSSLLLRVWLWRLQLQSVKGSLGAGERVCRRG